MQKITFSVFGHTRIVRRSNNQWQLFKPSGGGMLMPINDVIIPDSLTEPELAGYLADIYHEWACEAHPSVIITAKWKE